MFYSHQTTRKFATLKVEIDLVLPPIQRHPHSKNDCLYQNAQDQIPLGIVYSQPGCVCVNDCLGSSCKLRLIRRNGI